MDTQSMEGISGFIACASPSYLQARYAAPVPLFLRFPRLPLAPSGPFSDMHSANSFPPSAAALQQQRCASHMHMCMRSAAGGSVDDH
jgi:hypothetical protein